MEIQAVNSININFSSKAAAAKNFAAGEKYSGKVVAEAINLLNYKDVVIPENYKKSFSKCMSEVKFQPIEWLAAKLIRKDYEIGELPLSEIRDRLGLATFGLTELLKLPEAGIRKLINALTFKNYSKKVSECLDEFKREL